MDAKTPPPRSGSTSVLWTFIEAEGSQACQHPPCSQRSRHHTKVAIYPTTLPAAKPLLNAVVDSEFEKLVGFFDRSNGFRQTFEAAMIHSMDGHIDYA